MVKHSSLVLKPNQLENISAKFKPLDLSKLLMSRGFYPLHNIYKFFNFIRWCILFSII